MNNNIHWILKNGTQKFECPSFPYAFRAAFNIIRTASEAGKSVAELIKGITIIGPVIDKDSRKPYVYSYTTATQRALDQGLLTSDGQINSKEFKKKF